MILSSLSAEARHTATWALIGSSFASWLVDHSSLITALVGLATVVWVVLGWVERAQHIYFNWKYGPNDKTGDE